MKTWKLFWVCVFVGVMSSGFLTACGKGGDNSSSNNNLSYGSVTSDGTNVTSSSTLAGMPISISITGISRGYGGGYPSYPTNNNYYGGYGQSVSFQMSINGQTANLQATTQESGFVTQIAMFYIDTAIGCYDSSCNTVLLAVIVAGSGGYGGYGGNYEYKEIAVRKNMTNGQIESVREFQGGVGQMVPIAQLMSQM